MEPGAHSFGRIPASKIPLKERYPTTHVDLPSGWEIGGLARWMDNRYLLVTLSNPNIHPGKQKGISSRESRAPINERIYVLDSETGNTYYLKIGRLECYRANQIVHITGTYDEQIVDIGGTVVSPDGCRLFRAENKVGSYGRAFGFRGHLGAVIIDFCKGN